MEKETKPTRSFYLWVGGKHHKVPEAVYVRFRQMENIFLYDEFSNRIQPADQTRYKMASLIRDDKAQDHFIKETYEFTQS